MKKWNEIKDRPMTWGSYLKFGGIAAAVSVLISAAAYVCIFMDDIRDRLDEIIIRLPWNK